MSELLQHAIRTLIDWIFRRKSPALQVMRIGLGCLTAALSAGFVIAVTSPFLRFQLNTGDGTPSVLIYGAALLGGALIIVGLVWELKRYRSEQKRLSRKKAIVVEVRGLRDGPGQPLTDAVPSDIEGHRDLMHLDVRQGVVDGKIVSPQAAVDKLVSLPVDLARRESGLDRSDLTRVFGGLAPVPLTFLTGILMDDEASTAILDWDRYQQRWRTLTAADDGKRFRSSGIEEIAAGTQEVALLVSISYQVDAPGVARKLPGLPQVSLLLEDGVPDSHWSEVKQRALGRQFLEMAIQLGNRGVRRIHLFLAGQNSIVFWFGCLYDKRNLPEVIVYQYQREEDPPYPWGVLMPVSGRAKPEVV